MPTTTPDTTVATAINCVLEAEREVAAAVTRAQAEAQTAIDAAREARRNILERARLRIGRVREIAQRKLSAQIAALEHDESTMSVDDAEVTTAGDAAIVTRVGAVPDVVVDGVHGLFVPPHNPLAIARAIARLAADRGLLARMSEACRRRIAGSYSLERLAADFRRLYFELCAGRDARALIRPDG